MAARQLLFNDHVLRKYITLLALRTAELHRALAGRDDLSAFAPEPYTSSYQQAIRDGLKMLVETTFKNQTKNLKQLSAEVHTEAEAVLAQKKVILDILIKPFKRPVDAMRTRIHGDFHLGQVLFTGDDFIITDFEGEPGRTYAERRYKHSPLRDVAGMIRSLQYAAYASVLQTKELSPEFARALTPVMQEWYDYASGIYLDVYLKSVHGSAVLPDSAETQRMLLNSFLLEKAVYELNYELNNRPDWAMIPLRGIQSILQTRKTPEPVV
jgi:maltose alpha-D-glucosyltransferase/alpha-amylase